jgi:hypothetical protein
MARGFQIGRIRKVEGRSRLRGRMGGLWTLKR